MTDIHLNPNYKPDVSDVSYCIGEDKAEQAAYFGRAHCDSP